MYKHIRTFCLLEIIVLSFLLYSCSFNNSIFDQPVGPNSDPSLNLINYEKHFVAKDFNELNNIIMSQNSLYEDELEFYYNKVFLEKYNFTVNPDYNNKEEFYYKKHDLLEYYFDDDYKLPFYLNDLVLDNSKLQYNHALLSTPKETLDTLSNGSYEILPNNESLNPYYNNMKKYHLGYLHDGLLKYELNYGITYVARSFEKYCDNDFELSLDEGHVIHDSIDICPNHLYPEVGHELFNKRVCTSWDSLYDYTAHPVVRYTNFEFMYLVGRIYIEDKPIDCLIFMRNSYNIDSKKELLDVFEKGGYYNSIGMRVVEEEKGSVRPLNFVIKSTIKSQKEYDRKNNELCANSYTINLGVSTMYDEDEIKCFEHGIVFFTVPFWKNAYSDDLQPEFVDPSYLFDYEQIYDEYFDTFADGMEEVKIIYKNHRE